MLRAGICDLGTCDLEMGGRVSPAGPAGWDALRPVRPPTYRLVRRPRTVSSPWRERSEIGHAGPPRYPACVQRRAASLLRVPPEGPLTCGFTVWRAITGSIYARRALRVSRMAAACFRPGAMRFPPAGHNVSPRWAPHVSAGVPQRFRWSAAGFPPGTVAFRREGGRRAAARYRRGRPDGPGAGDRRRPLPSRVIHFADGRTRRDDRAVRPAGGQPLTSGPARVRLIRRMTRRSRSMAAR